MKYIISLLFLCSCSSQTIHMIDDILEGEAKVGEQIIIDASEFSKSAPVPLNIKQISQHCSAEDPIEIHCVVAEF